jgi:hypothetical protein
MKTLVIHLFLLCVCPWLLTGCESYGPMKVGVCQDGTCINFEIPGSKAGGAGSVKESGKEVVPVQ